MEHVLKNDEIRIYNETVRTKQLMELINKKREEKEKLKEDLGIAQISSKKVVFALF